MNTPTTKNALWLASLRDVAKWEDSDPVPVEALRFLLGQIDAKDVETARLRGLVVSGHVFHEGLQVGDMSRGGCSCGFSIEGTGWGRTGKMLSTHVSHVAKILDGTP